MLAEGSPCKRAMEGTIKMAKSLEFFPLDCHLDEKFEYIEAQLGLAGFAILVKLFQKIYGGEGYYCEWSDRVALLFAKRNNVGCNVVQEAVSLAIKERIFDEAMFENYGILTSRGIQKRFLEVAKRRAVIFEKPEYVLIECTQNSKDVDKKGKNVNILGENVSKIPLKESKESKGKESKGQAPAAAPPANAAIADNKNRRLCMLYGEEKVKEYEQKFSEWKAKKGNIKVDKYAIIEKWLTEDCCKIDDSRSSFNCSDVMAQIKARYKNK